MTKIIDAALLDEKLAALSREKGSVNYDCTLTKEEVLKLIQAQPKADGVLVTHCVDCVLFNAEESICPWWNIHVHDKKNYCLIGTEKTQNQIITE